MQTGSFIYAGFASHCVQWNFTGWIIGWHANTGSIVEAFATEGGPEGAKGGGVWMSGGGLAQDSANRMFFATGNGYASQLHGIPLPGRQPPSALEEAVSDPRRVSSVRKKAYTRAVIGCAYEYPARWEAASGGLL